MTEYDSLRMKGAVDNIGKVGTQSPGRATRAHSLNNLYRRLAEARQNAVRLPLF
jgi:hypothetical protein